MISTVFEGLVCPQAMRVDASSATTQKAATLLQRRSDMPRIATLDLLVITCMLMKLSCTLKVPGSWCHRCCDVEMAHRIAMQDIRRHVRGQRRDDGVVRRRAVPRYM